MLFGGLQTAGASETEALRPALDLAEELVGRTVALARGARRPPRHVHRGEARLIRRVDACELRARRLSRGLEHSAALDFLGEAIATLAVDEVWQPGEARAIVVRVARELDLDEDGVAFAVFRRTVASRECVQLPPAVAADLILSLVVELAPAAAASLWVADAASTRCLVGVGSSPRSRRLRESARATLDGLDASSPHVRAICVDRWDRPHAALVARAGAGHADLVDAFLVEAAAALAPVLEHEALFERNAEQERTLVSAGERRLARLGFDLHDGPLQEIVAFAEDLRHARSQIATLLESDDARRVEGRFDDLDSRLASLDEGLRQIVRSTRAGTALERPLDEALRLELETLERTTSIEGSLELDGVLDDLTDSQKIVVFRVVQEALSNVRKHSGASRAEIAVRSTRTFIEVTVADNGRGFDPEVAACSGRLGLAGLGERVRLLGGAVFIEARSGEGARVRATLPHWRPAREQRAAVYAVRS